MAAMPTQNCSIWPLDETSWSSSRSTPFLWLIGRRNLGDAKLAQMGGAGSRLSGRKVASAAPKVNGGQPGSACALLINSAKQNELAATGLPASGGSGGGGGERGGETKTGSVGVDGRLVRAAFLRQPSN